MKPDRERRRSARKLFQLCRQIERALGLAFAGCRDPRLHALEVISVRPAPDASRLAVALAAPDDAEPEELLEAARRVEAAAGRLRDEVAASISRRRVPLLVYRVLARADSS